MNNLNYSLSNDDIEQLLVLSGQFIPDEIYIITYDELNDIDIKTLPRGSCIVILYRTKENYGHWTSIYRPMETNKIFFFDSIGNYTDDDLFDKEIFPYNKEVGQTKKILSEKLYNSNFIVEYLDYECQMEDNNINTCGKWTVFFLIFAKMMNIKELNSLKRFLNMIKKEYRNNGLLLDDFVNDYIISIINKKII